EVLQIRHTIIANYSSFPRRGIDMYEELVNSSALIPTGIASLDVLLQGGLFTGNLYEVYGLSGDGKTQLCLAIACNVAHYLKQRVHYIDTKFDFSGKRIQAMLEARACSDG
ncbi:unnamed protein product, partial [Timema podura]|nr:unnamed protein product [Timema podura]